MNMKPFLLGAAFALAVPFAASAATLTTGFNYDMTKLSTGNSYNVSFETGGQSWTISDISFTANGAYKDISKVTITLSSTGETYDAWVSGEGNTATLLAEGFVTSSDFIISYVYATGGTGTVLVTASFDASLTPVPAPAAGLLLGSALLGLGAARRRKKS